jgi:S1-C subfamily serine protease
MRKGLGIVFAAAVLLTGAQAWGADYKTLRNLDAPPPTQVTPLPRGATPRPVQFARIVFQPQEGEAWALVYFSSIRGEDDPRPDHQLIPWSGGRSDTQVASFGRVFDEEMKKAGFKSEAGDSLFDTPTGTADLKVGVLIDDIEGRYCIDCPNILNPHGIPATVVMTAHWEIYASLERKVVAKITTSGGANDLTKLQGANVAPAVFSGFRENVRQLLNSAEFRRVVTSPVAGGDNASQAPLSIAPIALIGPKLHKPLSQAATSVAEVFAANGAGSGFLVSADGYVITNRHVVGGSKYVKLKWPDGQEGLGEVVRSDARRDVALIKTEAHGRAPLPIRTSPVEQGESVYAIGTPLDDKLLNTMTRGIISAQRTEDGLSFIQSDVEITHGNSGGPLLDAKGAVVALSVSGLQPHGDQIGINFFIPIGEALKALALEPAAD